VAAGSKD
jgi:20S proteasome alpha/beta subunit